MQRAWHTEEVFKHSSDLISSLLLNSFKNLSLNLHVSIWEAESGKQSVCKSFASHAWPEWAADFICPHDTVLHRLLFFLKKKKRRNHSRFGCRLTSTLPFFLLHGSPAGHSPGRPLALVHTLASVMWLPCSSSPPPSHQSDPVGARAAPSSQLHVKMRVRHKSCYHPRTIPPDVCHVNKNPWKAPNLAWSRPGTFPNFFVWSSFGKVRLPQVTG